MKRFTAFISGVVLLLSMGAGITYIAIATAPAAALSSHVIQGVADAKSDACSGIGLTGGTCAGTGAQTQANNLLSSALQLFVTVVGIAAVIMVIVAGMKYTTSGGDPTKIANAKTTLIYALVGIAVAAAAETLIHYVLTNV